ncbi:MAG: inositol monophosphatase family protein, partial [Planctomycetota bacterium]
MSDSAALDAALRAGRWAAAACQAVRAARGMESRAAKLDKADKSPVTVADFAAQAMVCRALEQAFPDDPIVGEEDAAALRSGEHAPFARQVVEAINTAG